jgi:2-phospho-L-lactate/phosphoenolpyruvate guanylyltransferase
VKWTAVVPFKGREPRKTRLRTRLSLEECHWLSQNLFERLLEVLHRVPVLSEIVLLSDMAPTGWEGKFFLDGGGGLNRELSLLVSSLRPTRLIVINADLPLVSPEDIEALIAEGEHGCSIAPDRSATGTNAVALAVPMGFEFAFGTGSFAKHLIAAGGRARIVTRLGLGLDVDTGEDLDSAIALGFSPRYSRV